MSDPHPSFLGTQRGHATSWFARFDPIRREIVLANLVLLVLLLLGTSGYALLEGWSVMDGLYMTFLTLSTIGFGEVHPLTTPGRLFTIFLSVVGFAAIAVVAIRSAQLLLASTRPRYRRIRRSIQQMENHYIICGYGRIGRRIVEDLRHTQKPFVLIDRDEKEVEALLEDGIPAVEGDAEDEETLREAGIERAYGLIITLPEDSTNVFVTLVAREMNPGLFILARMNDAKNQRKLIQAGANKVIAPSDVGADRMAQVILRPNVDRFMEEVLKTGTLGFQMEEVTVEEGAPLAGKTFAQSRFRQRFDVIVIAVVGTQTDEVRFNPGPHDLLQAGETLIVLGNEEMINRLRLKGCRAPQAL